MWPAVAATVLVASALGPPGKVRVALVSGSVEYKSDESLTDFQKVLERNPAVECVRVFRRTDRDLPGLDKLAGCDVAVFYTRRLTPPVEQLRHVKDFVASGKPVVGVRTASHGFQNWLAMDKDVFGGDYKNHHPAGPKCAVKLAATRHPVLDGVTPWASAGSLYKNKTLAPDVTVLLTGTTAPDPVAPISPRNPAATDPVAWARERPVGGRTQRVFYTSLGHPDDFAEPAFRRLLLNALGWCVRDPRPFTAPPGEPRR